MVKRASATSSSDADLSEVIVRFDSSFRSLRPRYHPCYSRACYYRESYECLGEAPSLGRARLACLERCEGDDALQTLETCHACPRLRSLPDRLQIVHYPSLNVIFVKSALSCALGLVFCESIPLRPFPEDSNLFFPREASSSTLFFSRNTI